MSSIAAVPAAPSRVRVLADVIARPSSRARAFAVDAALVLAGAAVVALLAQVEIPLWPVPITGQTLGVIIVGASLGAWRGAAALTTYMVLGLAGLPIFAGLTGSLAALAKPSFGFVIGFIFSAFVAGWFAERAWDRRPALAFVGFAAASIVPFLFGIPYLAFVLNVGMGLELSFWQILEAGLFPFIVGGLIKAGIAALIIPGAWALVRKVDAGKTKES
ncbi:biotin transport system substrate-specific component [Microbacterium sp. cf046]|uniref:biotin transporter BioY n=1 Tax=Microbacterium sp. cf046 TaxID=1761803 RepID=UPI0008E279DF|nr:biotin transporter BioY [Microbacterium sp. cf046]SFS04225.1 biotin transport system substrate-specific component [Microbacterium sp. cf046]